MKVNAYARLNAFLLTAALLMSLILAAGVAGQGRPDLIWMRGGHHGAPTFDFSPDGAMFATAADDNTIKLWDGHTGYLLKTIEVGAPVSGAIQFSPSEPLLAHTRDATNVELRSVPDGGLIRTIGGHYLQVTNFEFSPDGSILATGDYSGRLRLWNVSDGSLIRSWIANSSLIYGIGFSPDGTLVATGGDEVGVKIWRVADGSLVRQMAGHDSYTVSCDFAPDGQALMTAGGMNSPSVKIWRVSDGALLRTIRTDNFISSARYAPDGQFVVSSDYWGLKLWNPSNGQLLRSMTGGKAFDISPDSQTIVSNNYDYTALYGINLWRASDGALLVDVPGHMEAVRSVAISLSGSYLATCCDYFESSVKLWNPHTGEKLHTMYYSEVSDGASVVTFSPDERFVAAGGGKGYVRIWRTADGGLETTLMHSDSIGPVYVYGVAFSHNGTIVATGANDRVIKIWNTFLWGEIQRLAASPVSSLQFSPDDSILAVGYSGRIAIWDVATWKVLRDIAAGSSYNMTLNFTPDGQHIVAGNWDGNVYICSVSDGAVVRTLTGHSGNVFGSDVSPDGQYIISGGADGTARIWQFTDGSQVRLYDVETGGGAGYYGGVTAVGYSPDNTLISYGRGDGTVATARNPFGPAVGETYHPTDATILKGTYNSGNLQSLAADDDNYWTQAAQYDPTDPLAVINSTLQCDANAQSSSYSSGKMTVIEKANTSNAKYRIRAVKAAGGLATLVDNQPSGFSESVFSLDLPQPVSDFIDAANNNRLRLEIRCASSNRFAGFFRHSIDLVSWELTP